MIDGVPGVIHSARSYSMSARAVISQEGAKISLDPNEYYTNILMIVPLSPSLIPEESYDVHTSLGTCVLNIDTVNCSSEDYILEHSKKSSFFIDSNGFPFVPIANLTDSKGKYPKVSVSLEIPCIIIDSEFSKMHVGGDYEGYRRQTEIELYGVESFPEKVFTLIQLNKVIKEHSLFDGKTIRVEDVTAFIVSYRSKVDGEHDLIITNLLTTQDAYLKAAKDFYLPGSHEGIDISLARLRAIHKDRINSDRELFRLVVSAVDEVIYRNLEVRRNTSLVWDGRRKVNINGIQSEIEAIPKGEVQIQPTLEMLLKLSLEPFGVHVIRESDEGSGLLDFRFTMTGVNREIWNVALEVKLAHHKKIAAGLEKQLPIYMDSIPCLHGLFLVLWFKDEKGKYFKYPENRNLQGMRNFLSEKSEAMSSDGRLIESRVIDCSLRPSASKS